MILLPGTDLVPSPSWHVNVRTKWKQTNHSNNFLDIEGAWFFLTLASLVGNMIGSAELLTRSSPLPWNCQLRPLLSHQHWPSIPRPCGVGKSQKPWSQWMAELVGDLSWPLEANARSKQCHKAMISPTDVGARRLPDAEHWQLVDHLPDHLWQENHLAWRIVGASLPGPTWMLLCQLLWAHQSIRGSRRAHLQVRLLSLQEQLLKA